MNANEIKAWVQERDEAMFSQDKDKIMTYLKKYNIPIPKNDLVFWAGIYKSILVITTAPQDLKEKAGKWLDEHGFSREIF